MLDTAEWKKEVSTPVFKIYSATGSPQASSFPVFLMEAKIDPPVDVRRAESVLLDEKIRKTWDNKVG
jgi:hypothetical protein